MPPISPPARNKRNATAAATANARVRAQRAAAILAVVRQIPRGRVTTYGAIAERAGLPRQARLVGRVLGGLPEDSDVPWQRVVGAGGRIAFPARSAARERQVARLRRDGIDAAGGRVDLECHGWGAGGGSLDQLLWAVE